MLYEISFVDGTSEYLNINEFGKLAFCKLIKKYKQPFSVLDLEGKYYKSYCFLVNKQDWLVLFFTDTWRNEGEFLIPSKKRTCKPMMYWVKTKHGKLPSECTSAEKTLLEFKKVFNRELPENMNDSVLDTWADLWD